MVKGEYITLGQLLKVIGLVETGGQVRPFLEGATIRVNADPENRRGRKLYPGDRVEVENRVIHLDAQEVSDPNESS